MKVGWRRESGGPEESISLAGTGAGAAIAWRVSSKGRHKARKYMTEWRATE